MLTMREIAEKIASMKGKYIEFTYAPPADCAARKLTPSAIAERERTIAKAPLNMVKAFVGEGIDEKAMPHQTKAGNWCITMLTMLRQDVETKLYKYRSYRMDGINLETVKVTNGSRGKESLFPQHVEYGERIAHLL